MQWYGADCWTGNAVKYMIKEPLCASNVTSNSMILEKLDALCPKGRCHYHMQKMLPIM